jgi:hypothetical protein
VPNRRCPLKTETGKFSLSQWVPLLLCVVGAIIVLLVPTDHVGVVVRTAAFLVFMAPMPGWSLVRSSGGDDDWIERTVAAVVASMALIGAVGFLTTALINHAWTLHVVLFVIVGITLLTTLAGGASAPRRISRGAVGFALALSVATSGSAAAVHLLTFPVPVETAFSLEVSGSYLTPDLVDVILHVQTVGPSGPASLTLSAGYHVLDSIVVPRGATTVSMHGRADAITGNLCNDIIRISAPNSSYLTPVMTCHRNGASVSR